MKKSTILLCIGVILCLLPVILSLHERRKFQKIIDNHMLSIDRADKSDIQQELESAIAYNIAIADFAKKGTPSKLLQDYDKILNTNGKGLMSVIEIPKINLVAPIYHGTADTTLNEGIGHDALSALPVGGESTRCILTGHRGLPNSKLFTRLDEIKTGDVFLLKTLNINFAYKVIDVKVVKPEQANKLGPVPGKDYVTLVTCTPFGINTHRLLVTGERIPYDPMDYESISTKLPGLREFAFAYLPVILLVAMGVKIIIKKIRQKERKKEE